MTELTPWLVILGLAIVLLVGLGVWQGALILRRRNQWKLLSSGIPDVLWYWNDTKKRFFASPRVWDWFPDHDRDLAALWDRRHEFIPTEDLEHLQRVGQELASGLVSLVDVDFRLVVPGQAERWIRLQGVATRRRRVTDVAGSLSDVTELRALGKQLWRSSHLDPLTGLFNRNHLVEHLSQRSSVHTLLVIDIDHFSAINEAYRHEGGDRVLVWFAEVLKALFRGGDLLARSGGDEFVVVVEGELELAERLAERIHERLREPFPAIPVPWVLTVSIGVVPWSVGERDTEEVLSRAEQALEQSHSRGGGQSVVFDDAIADQANRRAQLEQELPRAVRERGLHLVFQPQYHLHDHRLSGFEALARWDHGQLGPVSPAEFIPLAEKLGLIPELGSWALESACEFLAAIPREDRENVTVSVNVSALQLRDPEFLDQVERTIWKAGVATSNVELELTESVLIHSSDEVFRVLAQLRNRGYKIALDDFGKGYSSLSYLRLMPLDTLKIDRDFIVDAAHDALLGGIVRLGRILGLQIIGEGVEDEAQLHQLKAHGCDKVQGFWMSRPLDRERALGLFAPTQATES